ncbi:MAG: hypothetical protein U0935_00370 [Pirellulales bacterium]
MGMVRMGQLYSAVLLMTGLAAGMFGLSWRFTRGVSIHRLNLLALAVVALLVVYVCCVWDQWWLAQLLPFSSLPVLSNWLPLWAGGLAAIVARRLAGDPWRQGSFVGALFLVAESSLLVPLFGSPPACGQVWTADGICLQTTPATCSAACAATLLRLRGIAATEQEMAELCLTRHGTTWQGLYRGLKAKTAGTGWDVEVSRGDLHTLQALSGEPVILRVGLARGARVPTELVQEMGWRPGTGHSVLFLGFLPHRQIEVADPSPGIGREQWPVEDLATLWDGQIVRLVPRSASPSSTAERQVSLAPHVSAATSSGRGSR